MRAHFGLPSVKSGKEQAPFADISLTWALVMSERWLTERQLIEDMDQKRPISVKYEIPYFTTSGIQVRYLKITEKSGYQALPWVRYITQNGGDFFVLLSQCGRCLLTKWGGRWANRLSAEDARSHQSKVENGGIECQLLKSLPLNVFHRSLSFSTKEERTASVYGRLSVLGVSDITFVRSIADGCIHSVSARLDVCMIRVGTTKLFATRQASEWLFFLVPTTVSW